MIFIARSKLKHTHFTTRNTEFLNATEIHCTVFIHARAADHTKIRNFILKGFWSIIRKFAPTKISRYTVAIGKFKIDSEAAWGQCVARSHLGELFGFSLVQLINLWVDKTREASYGRRRSIATHYRIKCITMTTIYNANTIFYAHIPTYTYAPADGGMSGTSSAPGHMNTLCSCVCVCVHVYMYVCVLNHPQYVVTH